MKVRIAGIEATVVSQEEAERAAMVVCCRAGTPSPFADNIETACASCGHPVFHRPTAPRTPMKVCMDCALAIVGDTRQ